MICREIQGCLQDGDRRVLREAGVKEHLQACADCRKVLESTERVDAALKKLPEWKPPSGVVEGTFDATRAGLPAGGGGGSWCPRWLGAWSCWR
jgi:predicted anti-sigma-YlaC factor YlaD